MNTSLLSACCHDFSLPSRCIDAHHSGVLRSLGWYKGTDVSGLPIFPIFNGQAETALCLTTEEGDDTFFRNVGNYIPVDAA